MPTPSAKVLNDRLQNAGPGEPVEVWIYSAFPKGWVIRKSADATHAEHPGTAIKMPDKLYEVVRAEETAEPGYVIRYGLKTWEAHHAVRQLVPYTPQAQAQAAADYLHEQHAQSLRAAILWLFPFAGLAPDPVQREWARKTALNMAWVSAGSAALGLGLAFILREVLFRAGETRTSVYIVYYLAFESFIRLLWTACTLQPHGSPALTIPYLLWEAVAHPEKRAAKKEAWVKFSYEGDEVIRRPDSGHLTVRSMVFDDMLAGPNPIRFEGDVYRPLHWHLEGKGLVRRWVYELEKIDTNSHSKCKEYTRPRSPERQKAVEAFTHRLDITQSFALVWGTFPRRDQLRLQMVYHFAAAKFTAITAGVFLATAFVQVGVAILAHTTIFALASPLYLLFESVYRLYKAKALGEPAGCLVGYLLRLVIRPPL